MWGVLQYHTTQERLSSICCAPGANKASEVRKIDTERGHMMTAHASSHAGEETMADVREALADCCSETRRLLPDDVLAVPAVQHMLLKFLAETSRSVSAACCGLTRPGTWETQLWGSRARDKPTRPTNPRRQRSTCVPCLASAGCIVCAVSFCGA